MEIEPIYFPDPLLEGVVLERKNPFIMLVDFQGKAVPCHCPTTWHIGNLEVAGRPCLLSRTGGLERKTPFTVEAVSLDRPEAPAKKWIGINLTAANRYVEYYLERGGFAKIVGHTSRIHRARLSGKANLDFVVGSTAIAIKAPLLVLGLDVPPEMRIKTEKPFPSTERFIRRITSLREGLPNCKRAVLITVFLYDHPDFDLSEYRCYYEELQPVLERSAALCLENWQANFIITKDSVRLDRCLPLQMRTLEDGTEDKAI